MLATPISGPALTWTPQLVPLLMELPTVFVMPTVSAPRDLQYLRALRVSAVSPEGKREEGERGEERGEGERGRERRGEREHAM